MQKGFSCFSAKELYSTKLEFVFVLPGILMLRSIPVCVILQRKNSEMFEIIEMILPLTPPSPLNLKVLDLSTGNEIPS